jgi:hypothetical protein
MTDSWKADSRFISRSHSNSSERFVSADLRANNSGTFSPAVIVNEGSNENNAQSPVTYTQDELESKLAEIRQEVTDEVRQNLSSELESEKTNYRAELKQEFEAFLSAAKSKTVREEPFLEPVRALSLAFASEISRAAFSSPQMKIEKAIDDCLIGLDLSSLDGLEIYVSRRWAERLENEPLVGILADYPVFIEESFGDGDVRLKLNSSQVENLVSDRIAKLQEQLAKLDYGLLPEELKPTAMRSPQEEMGESVKTIENSESPDSEDSSEVLSPDTDGKSENDV